LMFLGGFFLILHGSITLLRGLMQPVMMHVVHPDEPAALHSPHGPASLIAASIFYGWHLTDFMV
jgi:hypothetical protein